MIAARSIQKGEVIFTERALEAAQLGRCSAARVVRGCQHCFQSLQPISCLRTTQTDGCGKDSQDSGDDDASSQCFDDNDELLLPYPHLWPIVMDGDNGDVLSVDCCQADENVDSIDGKSTNKCDASRFVARKCVKCKVRACVHMSCVMGIFLLQQYRFVH